MTASSASALLAACAAQISPSPCGHPPSRRFVGAGQRRAAAGRPASPAAPTPGEAITFPGPTGELQGFLATADTPGGDARDPREPRPHRPHPLGRGRLAADGYTSLAIDLLSEEGGTAALGDPGDVTGGAGRRSDRAPRRRHAGRPRRARAPRPGREARDHRVLLRRRQVWTLLDAGEPRLAAALPFYGPAPSAPDFSGNAAAVLGVYAELDERVNARLGTAAAALEAAGLDPRDQDLPRRRPRVLQRHRRSLRRRRRRPRPTRTSSPGSAATSPPKGTASRRHPLRAGPLGRLGMISLAATRDCRGSARGTSRCG